jgi:hypothetical protein
MNQAKRENPAPGGREHLPSLPPKTITERNWQEFRAEGWMFFGNYEPDYPTPVERIVARESEHFGEENVRIGDPYDFAERRPLAHKPGIGLYISHDAWDSIDG